MPRKPGPGRPKKSAEEHIAAGTYRADRHGPRPETRSAPQSRQVHVRRDAIAKPGDLTPAESTRWDELLSLLAGVVVAADVYRLTDLVRWLVRADLIAAEMRTLTPASKEFKPLVVAAAVATDKVERLSAVFGMSPADRAKLGMTVPRVMTRPQTDLDRTGPPRTGMTDEEKRERFFGDADEARERRFFGDD